MRVGILTFHNADNFGCVLQVFGLQEAIRTLFPDAEVEVINYERGLIELNGIIVPDPNEYQIRRSKKFKIFRSDYLNVYGKEPWGIEELPTDRYDICFVGSDQVWSYDLVAGQEKAYFLQFAGKQTRKASYAASIGYFTGDESRKAWVKENIQGMDSISIREESALSDISEITDKPVSICLDPTLLHDKIFWESIEKRPADIAGEKYVLMYALGYAWCREYEKRLRNLLRL